MSQKGEKLVGRHGDKSQKELDDERKEEANTSDLKKKNERLAVQIESSADGDDGIDYQELCQTVVQIEEDNDEEELANFVAFIGITEFVEGETETNDDQSSANGDDGIDYQELCQTVVQIGKENLCLKKEKSWLEDTVINLRKELDDGRKNEENTSDLKKENERLVVQIEVLEKQVKNEKARSSDLNAKLEHHYKTVRMLTGSKKLD
ncbi:hypothetical protein F2Q70_00042928 [Brassica cretica]|uniref:Uncharacterized protein n=1 Tax=Brassica cretica TaxID=69181 RepID=A0A8S9KCZ7_BRACR|nr:hypothetical protein F2Q70_00042928 [Brassica cretica]